MELLVIGRPHVGKTLLMINFAAYLGMSDIRVEVQDSDGRQMVRRLTLARARRELVSLSTPKTAQVHSLTIEVTSGRQRSEILLVDTPGVLEGIAPDSRDRQLTAQTIGRLMRAAMVFHVVDASRVKSQCQEAGESFDRSLWQFGQRREGYLLVANKVDRPGSHEGLKFLRDECRGITMIPTSCATRRGFRELKVWVSRAIP